MTAITRRSQRSIIPPSTVLAFNDDLDGTGGSSLPLGLDVTGAARVLILQDNVGTNGTAGVDAIEVSKDGGNSWIVDVTLMTLASDDNTGTILANGILNVAGTEPTTSALWKAGPYEGPTLIRCNRKTGTGTTNGTTWVTGAPKTSAILIGHL